MCTISFFLLVGFLSSLFVRPPSFLFAETLLLRFALRLRLQTPLPGFLLRAIPFGLWFGFGRLKNRSDRGDQSVYIIVETSVANFNCVASSNGLDCKRGDCPRKA